MCTRVALQHHLGFGAAGWVKMDTFEVHRALCTHFAKSWLFSTIGSHRSQGPEFCTLQPRCYTGYFFLSLTVATDSRGGP